MFQFYRVKTISECTGGTILVCTVPEQGVPLYGSAQGHSPAAALTLTDSLPLCLTRIRGSWMTSRLEPVTVRGVCPLRRTGRQEVSDRQEDGVRAVPGHGDAHRSQKDARKDVGALGDTGDLQPSLSGWEQQLTTFSFVCSLQQHGPNPPKSPAPLQQRLAVLFRPSPSSSDKPISPVSPQPSGNPELGLKANISQSLLRDTSSFHGQF